VRFFAIKTTRTAGIELARAITPPFVWSQLYRRLVVRDIPDAELYRPNYQPWRAPWFVEIYNSIKAHTVVPIERCWTIWQMASHAASVDGEFMEAGVFQGGTAKMLRLQAEQRGKRLHLFDSFEGMEVADSDRDRHVAGDFADTSLEAVQKVVGPTDSVEFHKGWIPNTFAGLENRKFCFAHVDLDLYQGVLDTLEFLYPRMPAGGVIISDDYGFASCPGARRAVDEFFADKPEKPLALLTGQGLIIKL
jgi:O-methyltransferase